MVDLTGLKPCKNGDAACGHYWTCGPCKREQWVEARKRQSPKDRAYDDYVDPLYAYHAPPYADGGCSCHISPPCSVCVGEGTDD